MQWNDDFIDEIIACWPIDCVEESLIPSIRKEIKIVLDTHIKPMLKSIEYLNDKAKEISQSEEL